MVSSAVLTPNQRGRPKKSQLEKTIDAYYRRLDRMESGALSEINRALSSAMRDIDQSISVVLEKISKASPFQDSRDLSRQLARLQDLQTQAAETLRKLGTDTARAIEILQTNASEAGARSAIQALEALGYGDGSFGILADFNLLNQKALNEVVGSLSDGSPLIDLARQYGDIGGQALRAEIIKGTALGLNPRQVADNWRRSVKGLSRAKAQTVVRTEMMRSFRESSRKTMEANADIIKGWQWYCSLDTRTCPMCWAMHGTHHGLREKMASHPNCRCTMLPDVKTFRELGLNINEPIEDERLRLSGSDLFRRMPPGDQRAILGPAGFNAYTAGAVRLTDFVGESNSAIWGKGRYAKSLSGILGRDSARQYYKRPPKPSGGGTPLTPKPTLQGSEEAWVREAGRRLGEIHTDQDVIELGRTIREGIENPQRRALLQSELDAANREYEELTERLYGDDAIQTHPKRDEWRAKRYELQQKRFFLEDEINRTGVTSDHFITEMRKVRPGFGEGDTSKLQFHHDSTLQEIELVKRAASKLPAEWVDDYAKFPIRTRNISRGYFDEAPWRAGRGYVEVMTSGGNPLNTMIHELTHFAEFTRPNTLVSMERMFYRRRTVGERERSLKTLFPQSNYGRHEKTRLDKFVSPYMGKEYTQYEGYYELASMGTESVLVDTPRYNISTDPEYRDFIIGLLAWA